MTEPEPDPAPEPEPTPEPALPDMAQPVLDLGREALRRALLGAIAEATDNITALRTEFATAQQTLTSTVEGLTALGVQVADLTVRVEALEG